MILLPPFHPKAKAEGADQPVISSDMMNCLPFQCYGRQAFEALSKSAPFPENLAKAGNVSVHCTISSIPEDTFNIIPKKR